MDGHAKMCEQAIDDSLQRKARLAEEAKDSPPSAKKKTVFKRVAEIMRETGCTVAEAWEKAQES